MVVELCSSVIVSLLGFVSDECSLVVAFVAGLFIYGYIFLFRYTFRMSIDVYTLTFWFFVYYECYILFLVACCPIKATGGRVVFLFLSDRRRAYLITTFHSLLLIILLSQPP